MFLYQMSSPLCKQVLKSLKKESKHAEQKPVWVYRLEQKISEQEKRIQHLEDQLEESNIENKRLRESIPIPVNNESGSPQFKLSL